VLRNRTSSRLAKVTLAFIAVTCAAVGRAYGGSYGVFLWLAGLGVLSMLLVLLLASHRPKWSGGIPGLLGGMIAGALAAGWQEVPSWGGLAGGLIAILAWVVVEDREAAVEGT
jgi:hypothetical protein